MNPEERDENLVFLYFYLEEKKRKKNTCTNKRMLNLVNKLLELAITLETLAKWTKLE